MGLREVGIEPLDAEDGDAKLARRLVALQDFAVEGVADGRFASDRRRPVLRRFRNEQAEEGVPRPRERRKVLVGEGCLVPIDAANSSKRPTIATASRAVSMGPVPARTVASRSAGTRPSAAKMSN